MQAQFPPRVGIKPPGWPGMCPYPTSEGSRVLRENHPTLSPSEVYQPLEAHHQLSHISADRSCATCFVSCGLTCTVLLPMGQSPGFSFSDRASYQSRLSSSSHLALEDRLPLAPLVPLSPWEGNKGEMAWAFQVLVRLTRLS